MCRGRCVRRRGAGMCEEGGSKGVGWGPCLVQGPRSLAGLGGGGRVNARGCIPASPLISSASLPACVYHPLPASGARCGIPLHTCSLPLTAFLPPPSPVSGACGRVPLHGVCPDELHTPLTLTSPPSPLTPPPPPSGARCSIPLRKCSLPLTALPSPPPPPAPRPPSQVRVVAFTCMVSALPYPLP